MAAPLGNQNACRSNREYRNALLRTLKQYEASGTPRGEALNQVTTRLVELALKGEPWAIKANQFIRLMLEHHDVVSSPCFYVLVEN